MSATKVRVSVYAGQALTAGGADTVSPWQDLSAAYGAQLDISLTNGATGPTVAAQAQVEVASDYNGGAPNGPVAKYGGALAGGTANAGAYSWSIELPLGVAAFRVRLGSNTGQAVTASVAYAKVTNL